MELSIANVAAAGASLPVAHVAQHDASFENFMSEMGVHMIGVIGTGSYGYVYKAMYQTRSPDTSIVTTRAVAMKIYKSHALDNDHVPVDNTTLREINALRVLSGCKYIARLYDVIMCDNGTMGLLLEYAPVDVMNYLQLLKNKQGYGFSGDVLMKAALEFLMAVQYCHRHGIIHRDIKTSNLMMMEDGTLKLIDFGLSKTLLDTTPDYHSMNVITTGYRPPEMFIFENKWKYSFEVDVWSVGIVLLEFVFGSAVFARDMEEIMVLPYMLEILLETPILYANKFPEQYDHGYHFGVPLQSSKLRFDKYISVDRYPVGKYFGNVFVTEPAVVMGVFKGQRPFIDAYIRLVTSACTFSPSMRPSIDILLQEYAPFLAESIDMYSHL